MFYSIFSWEEIKKVKKTESVQEFRTPESTQAKLRYLSLNLQSKIAAQLLI